MPKIKTQKKYARRTPKTTFRNAFLKVGITIAISVIVVGAGITVFILSDHQGEPDAPANQGASGSQPTDKPSVPNTSEDPDPDPDPSEEPTPTPDPTPAPKPPTPSTPAPNPTPTTPTSKTFTATFIPNGATSIGASSLSCTTTSNSCTITAPTISRIGYTIKGWSTSTSGTNPISIGGIITLTANITFYAITESATPSYFIDASSMLDMINGARVDAGLEPLTLSASLTASTQIRAEEICTELSHTRPNGTPWYTVNSLAMAENIAAGQGSVPAAFNAWMNSAGHKANIMNPSYRTVGVAGYYCPSGSYKFYWAQLFGL